MTAQTRQQVAILTAAAALLLAIAAGCGSDESGGAQFVGDRVTFFGADAGDSAGAVAGGDFNGDGVLDFVLAATAADGPDNARPDAGEAYLFLGPFSPGERRDPAQGQYDAVIYGAHAGDQMGRALAAGDFNGDGVDDIALGAPFADGRDGSRPDSGEVYTIVGSASLGDRTQLLDMAEGEQNAAAYGADAGDLAGFSLHAANVNADRSADLIIGAFWADGPEDGRPNAGEVYVIYGGGDTGPVDLATGEQDVTIYGAESEDQLGEAVGAGDVNGDGVDDLILAAAFASGPDNKRDRAGETYVVVASPEPRLDIAASAPAITVLGADPGDQAGHSIASGDTNGDGFADVLLGAVSADGPNNLADLAGEAYLVLGGDHAPAVIEATEGAALIYGASAKNRLGRSAAAGDINGDGLSDLLIAAPDVPTSASSNTRAGTVYVFLGRKNGSYPGTSAEADAALEGLDGGDILGHEAFGGPPLTTADMNADGIADVLVSAPGADGPDNKRQDAGEAYIIFSAKK